MTLRLPRLGRLRRRPCATRPLPQAQEDPWPSDPTRPGAARIVDGVPIAHEGPPGYPGRPALPGDDDPEITG